MQKQEAIKEQLAKANSKFKEALEYDSANDIYRDSQIQRFEFTFELSWKFMRAFMQHQGVEVYAFPRQIIKQAGKYELVSDVSKWLVMLDQRNRTTHTYNEEDAIAVASAIKDFPTLVEELLEN